MNWEELNPKTLEWMQELGDFGPTVKEENKEVKGWGDGGKIYWGAEDLREIAAACLEVADWLEKRAAREAK